MVSRSLSRRILELGVVVLLLVLTLAGCGGGGSGTGNSGGPGKGVTVIVGSKLDADGKLLAEMYALLLQQQGYTVQTKLGLGQTPVLDAAIKNGSIDLYPEFTGTALYLLHQPSTQNAQQAYNTVKTMYQQQFNLVWLDPAYNLNDSYGLCTSSTVAQKYHLKTIEDVAPVASQLTLATQQDAVSVAVQPMESGYNLHFKNTIQINEPLSFAAVTRGDADLNICYTTDPAIVTNNFVLLTDSKNVFPIYNPAPVVRGDLLKNSPAIATTLNPLESKLSTAVIVGLIKQVSVDRTPVEQVARTFLQQQGLLPK